VIGFPALEEVRSAHGRAEVSGWKFVKYKRGGKLEPPRRIAVQIVQKPCSAAANFAKQKAVAAYDAQ
jgi:hypothetical protein